MSKLYGCRLLVLDDDPDSRELLTLIFEEMGAKVVATASAQAALHVLHWYQLDILLCDLVMPGVDGYHFLRHLRTSRTIAWKNVPAIAATALADDCSRQQAIAAGFQSYCTKPVDIDQLLVTVNTLVQQTALSS